MNLVHSTLTSGGPPASSEWDPATWRNRAAAPRFAKRAHTRPLLVVAAVLSLVSEYAFAQTTRTNPSAASTSPTTSSSSSTSPNSPCNSSNPTSPCYSANAPRNPCYSATNDPCSTTSTPYIRPSPAPAAKAAAIPQAVIHALTEDQARAQIEAKGFSSISRLQKDAKGYWHGEAEKDGLPVSVTLDREGNVTAN